MYIQSVVYDSSCRYVSENRKSSALPDSLYELTKEYAYVIAEEVSTESTHEMKENRRIE